MPGRQLKSFWEGSRAELLATHILSSVAAVTTVPVGFDFGVDLLCTLTTVEGRSLMAGKAFGVQVKAASTSEVRYGGLDERGNWKQHEIAWLFGQDQPILFCMVDLNDWTVNFYTAHRTWWIRSQVGWPGEIVLLPDSELNESFDGFSIINRYQRTLLEVGEDDINAGDRFSYAVPLGKPIASVPIREQSAQEYRNHLRDCLQFWIDLDYENIRHARQNVPYTVEVKTWEANVKPEGPNSQTIWHYANPTQDQNVNEILRSISPSLVALIYNLLSQKQNDKAHKVKSIAELADSYGHLDGIGKALLMDLIQAENDLASSS